MLTSRSRRAAKSRHSAGDPISTLAGPGSLICADCGYGFSMDALEHLAAGSTVPECPACGGTEFRRASIFDQPTVDADTIEPALSKPAWLAEVRVDAAPGPYVAYFDDEGEGPQLVPLREGWTRVGRNAGADVHLDDPSVSRRHALIVRTHSGGLRALDDRSLNGLFVNGERVEWTKLADGDELEIGRFRLHILVV
jgi:FHA domain/Zinc-ribbon containing domain